MDIDKEMNDLKEKLKTLKKIKKKQIQISKKEIIFVDLWVYGTKEDSYDAGEQAGLTGKRLEKFVGEYGVKLKIEVDKLGSSKIIKVNDFDISKE